MLRQVCISQADLRLSLCCSMQLITKSCVLVHTIQGWHRLEKYLNLEGFLEKSLKIKSQSGISEVEF